MENQVKSKLRFVNYKVMEVFLKQNEKFENERRPIDVQFTLKHHTDIKENNMKIKLEIVVFDNAEENNLPFYLKTVLEGEFEIEGEDIEKFEINAISLLYPYVRSIISTYTANSNIPTLVLPPINVINYYKSNKKS